VPWTRVAGAHDAETRARSGPACAGIVRAMTVSELRSIVSPVAALAADQVPATLLERAAAYNEAVGAFGEAIRKALGILQRGGTLEEDLVVSLRICAADLVTAREWLLTRARLPSAARLE
jgi:hypothetical protein